MQDSKRDTDVKNRLGKKKKRIDLEYVGEVESGTIG